MSQLVIPEIDLIPPQEGEKSYTCGTCQRSHERVTSILSAVIPKHGLLVWAEQTGRKAGYAAREAGIREDRVPAWAVEQGVTCDQLKLAGGDRGSTVHAYLEAYIRTGEVPPLSDYAEEHRGYLQQLARFILDYEPEFLGSEIPLVHHDLDYAGQTDGIALIGNQPPRRNKPIDLTGKRVLFDAKSNKDGRVYSPEHLYQMALYEYAWRDMGGEPNDYQVVVALGEEKYQLAVSYFEPEAAVPLVEFYHSMRAQQARNPNARNRNNGKR